MNGKKAFFFISYSQRDVEVQEDVHFFDDQYVNYWIDKDGMRATDDTWIARARETIMNENCKGVVFYLSVHSLASNAVETEIDIVSEKRKQSPDFFVFAVLVDGLSIPHLIKKLYSATEDGRLANMLPLSRIVKISEMFSDEKIYLIRQTDRLSAYREQLLKNLSECGVVLNQEAIEDKLSSQKKLDAYKRYTLGMFYEPVTESRIYLTSTNTFEEIKGKWYVRLEDGTVHRAEPIKWIILDYSKGNMRLISERVLEKIPGRQIDAWLNTFFLPLAFNDKEREMISGPVRTMTCDEYVFYSEQDEINPANDSFWLNSINKRNEPNMLMYVNGRHIDRNGYRKDKKLGIRPMIEIRAENM